ncbi:Rubredoxin-type Fe(Cys)4 protein [Cellulophaga algicola DSM 14237]|uniref:Rubredoxin-type Fe(Cys)4 protein n=1 Tax=Cellulophaga algicola (strain DSM 14237 / IC166 / ACAM 630) TaxID=688270 RepID=E6X8S2_CELAD|nr:rubredoxin [Cellulophaga algicola]ADV48667.1 Rubredoxin-type Fe(Cys)4 protein [Cellulophaga algicola DSM 14237]
MNDDLHRILLKGGVTSPGELKDVITMLEAAGLKEVHFGSRQDLLFPLNDADEQQLESISKYNTTIIGERFYQNIVSSYVCADIFDMTYWLKGSTYLYILEGFDYAPKLKINITDAKQRLVPIFSGNLNFIASESEDYWYLNIKLPHWDTGAYYPVLVYSWDINTISKAIEAIYEDIQDVDELFFVLNKNLDTNNKTIEKELEVPYLTFPYYEGMNRMGLDQYWLGLYWRNNRYDLNFLKEFCGFCLDNGVGKICITPWKSFIVKGIKSQSRPDLERFLGQWGINIRHSQLEMNWHLPVDDAEALELKKFLVLSFDQNDISTYGLTFGLSNESGKRTHFSSVVIEKNEAPTIVKDFAIRPTYNVLHFKNFDPNTQVYEVYAQDVDKIELPGLLMELSKKYFKQLGQVEIKKEETKKSSEQLVREVYQCASCFTVYDKEYGDEKAGVSPGTLFVDLPEDYSCQVCDASKVNFSKIALQLNS